MTHYPPVFPLLLAIAGSFTGNDIFLAARLLSALFFGINLVLVTLAMYICTRHDVLATGCAILIFLFSAPVLSIHSMAWSEAPFIAFSMTAFILLSQHVARPNPKYLLLASLMVGFAAATRYIGITLFPALVLALLFLGNRSFKQKIGDIIIFSCVACLPLLSWLIRNVLVAGSATNRKFAYHPIRLDHLKDLTTEMYNFILPISISEWLKILPVGAGAVLFVLAMKALLKNKGLKQSKSSIVIVLPSILLIYSVLYITFLFVSLAFFDAATPVDHRLLLPVFLALIVACTSVVKTLSEAYLKKWAWYGYAFFVFFSVSVNAKPAISRALTIHHEGSNYTARRWRQSVALAVLARIPEAQKIYSNGPDVIRLYTQKEASMLPAKVFPATRRKNENYQARMSQMIRECTNGNALIVYFNNINGRWYLPSKEEIEAQFEIQPARTMVDGVIYGLSVKQNKAEQAAAPDAHKTARQ
jgi:hypothetical protein